MLAAVVMREPLYPSAELSVLLRRRRKLMEKINDPSMSENNRAAARWFYDANELEIARQLSAESR